MNLSRQEHKHNESFIVLPSLMEVARVGVLLLYFFCFLGILDMFNYLYHSIGTYCIRGRAYIRVCADKPCSTARNDGNERIKSYLMCLQVFRV